MNLKGYARERNNGECKDIRIGEVVSYRHLGVEILADSGMNKEVSNRIGETRKM